MTSTEKKFKDNFIKYRAEKGISCYTLAKLLNTDHKYCYNIENYDKHVNPTFEFLEKVADFYNIQVSELFK